MKKSKKPRFNKLLKEFPWIVRIFSLLPTALFLSTGCAVLLTRLGSGSNSLTPQLGSQEHTIELKEVYTNKPILHLKPQETDLMPNYSINILTSQEAECPICRRKLVSNIIGFHDDLAFCQGCLRASIDEFLDLTILASLDPRMHRYLCTHRGLRFFCPTADLPRNTSLAHTAALLTGEDPAPWDRLEQTPAP